MKSVRLLVLKGRLEHAESVGPDALTQSEYWVHTDETQYSQAEGEIAHHELDMPFRWDVYPIRGGVAQDKQSVRTGFQNPKNVLDD